MNKKNTNALLLTLSLLFAALVVPNGVAGENTYTGVLNGENVTIKMNIDKSGKVSGMIWDSESVSGAASAAFDGTNYADGKIKIKVGYRFETLGTYELTKKLSGDSITWSDASKTFVIVRPR